MPTATQNQDGTWTINGLKWVKETGTVKPVPDDLVFTGTISYNNKDAVQVNVKKNGTNYQTDWKTMLGSKLDVNLLVLQCGDVTRKIDDKWYTYKAKSNFTAEDIHPFEAELNATCTNTTPGSDGGSATLNITANTSWSVECDDWITISPTEGTSEVTQAQVTYVENTGTDTRTGRISVYAGDKYVDISIEQSGFVPEISITSPSPISSTATSIAYTAISNVDNVIVELSDGQRKTDKIGSFTIPENTSSDPVTYTLTAFCANYTTYTATTTVIQNGTELLTPEVQSFDISFESDPTASTMAGIGKNGGKINLTAETLPTGHTISVSIEDLPSWITVDQSSTAQNWVGKVSQNEDVGERSYILTGTVTTNTDPEYEGTTSLTKTWTVTQAGNSGLPSPTINSTGVSYESYGPPTPSNPILTVYYEGHIGGASELWFGLATANTTSAIVASGYTVGSDVEEICSYTLPSTSTTLYLFYKANVSTTINMGIADSGGSSMNYQAWLGTTGNQPRPISVTQSWYGNGAAVTGWENNMHHVCTIFGVA